jgi:hypothetical protein
MSKMLEKDVDWVILSNGEIYIYWSEENNLILLKNKEQTKVYIQKEEVYATCNVRDLKTGQTPEQYFTELCPEFSV